MVESSTLSIENAAGDSAVIRARVPVRLANGAEPCFVSFNGLKDKGEHIALVFSPISAKPLVRIHSECATGDIFHSELCDCRAQLQEAIDVFSKQGGIILYLRQEGRGIGLYNKLDAYKLQKELGIDTYEANRKLGLADDSRDYCAAARMLKALDAGPIHLMTGNPDKVEQMKRYGIDIAAVVPTSAHRTEMNTRYIDAKIGKGHTFRMSSCSLVS